MNKEQCVAHYKSGARKGQRCDTKGYYKLFKDYKVCAKHRGLRLYYYTLYSDRYGGDTWFEELLERALLGRYDHVGAPE